MRRAEALALGLLQGPAELLPISSSAHVGLALDRLGVTGAERKEFEVALHAGTALALAAFDRRPLRWGLLIAATVPPALAGLALERPIEERLGTPRTIAAGLLAGAIAMVIADRTPPRRSETAARAGAARRPEAGAADGAWLGLAQALALIPGVSRSGATRAAARLRGFDREAAAELSREVALPVLAGATVLKGARLIARRPGRETVARLALGAGAAAISTAATLRVRESALKPWAAYRAGLAVGIVWQDRGR
jgi:undecaprenyl-diphosphatase